MAHSAIKKENQPKKNRWASLGLTNEKVIGFYRQMLLMRRFEERSAQEYGKGKIGGFCHLYIGQEAVGMGAIAALRDDDYIFSAYRDHGHALARGVSANAIMAELFGKHTGCSKGMGGSMHLFDASKNFMGGYGIVGGHVPLAAGTAFGTKYLGKDSVSICFFGEAAANQGVFHETLNIAALWRLPVIFICENNRYGMGTAVERSTAVWDIFQKASAYDMDRLAVDGMDVIEMYRIMKRAVERARKNYAPALIEARTYRFRGHSMSDPIHGHYRSKEEVEEQKKRDPLSLLGAELMEAAVLTQPMIDIMEEEIKATVAEAADFADRSPEPPAESLLENVYA